MNLLDALKTEAENGDFEGKIKLLDTLKPNGIPRVKGFRKKVESQNRQKRKALVWVRKFNSFEVNEILGYEFVKHGEQVHNIKKKKKLGHETKVKKHHSKKDKEHGEKGNKHEHKRSKKFKKRLRQLTQNDLWQSIAPEERSFWQPSSKLGEILCYRCTPYIQIDKIFRELTCTICKHQTYGEKRMNRHFEESHKKVPHTCKKSEEASQGSPKIVQEFSKSSEKNQEKYQNLIEKSEESPKKRMNKHIEENHKKLPHTCEKSEEVRQGSPTIAQEFSKSSEKNQEKYQNLIEKSEESPEILQESSHDLSTNSVDPDADTESEGIQEAIDPWGDIDTDFTSLPETEIQVIKKNSKEKEVSKEKAEEYQEKEEGEITDEDSDNENFDNLLAKTRNRFLVVSKRNGNPVSKQKGSTSSETGTDSTDEDNETGNGNVKGEIALSTMKLGSWFTSKHPAKSISKRRSVLKKGGADASFYHLWLYEEFLPNSYFI